MEEEDEEGLTHLQIWIIIWGAYPWVWVREREGLVIIEMSDESNKKYTI